MPVKDEGLGRTASGLDPRLVYPAFREELVGSLLHAVLANSRWVLLLTWLLMVVVVVVGRGHGLATGLLPLLEEQVGSLLHSVLARGE